MRQFTINGKRYDAKPFDFNTVCDLEDSGVSLAQMRSKPMSMVRAYFALCFNGSTEDAGKEIQAHVVSGGDFNALYEQTFLSMVEPTFEEYGAPYDYKEF